MMAEQPLSSRVGSGSDNSGSDTSGPGGVVSDDVVLSAHIISVATSTRGFLPEDEADALVRAAADVARRGPLLEIGAYCGRSSVYLGGVASAADTVLFSVDHHRGSEENQLGWEWHDPELVDPSTGRMDTLPLFRSAIERAGLEHHVVALVGDSPVIARHWGTPLALCFIDGGHGRAVAHGDYDGWAHHVMASGLLAIHDVFPDPAQGGRPPYDPVAMFKALILCGTE